MKLSAAVSYRFKYQIKALAFYFSYFFVLAIVFPLIGIFFAGSSTVVSTDALFSSFIFICILSFIGVSTDFKLFIQNGMSRNNIFLSSLISNASMSFFLAGILIVFKSITNDLLIKSLRVSLFFSDIYTKDNGWQAFIFLFLFFLLGCSVASAFGTFNDRVQGFKKLAILATLVIIPILFGLVLQIAGPTFKNSVWTFVKNALGITSNGLNVFSVIITMIVLILILSIITFLMNYKREIKRING